MKITHTLRLDVLLVMFMTGTLLPSAIGQRLAWRVNYDDQGRIAHSSDPAGRITQYTYTSASNGQLQSMLLTPPEGSPVDRQFNADAQLATMTDGEGKVIYNYDNSGRLIAVERVGSPAIHYSYDDADRVTELRIGDFYRVAWTYDFLGRIAKIETPAGPVTYDYQTGLNMVVRALPNGIKTFWKRQANGELEQITHGYFEKSEDTSYNILAQYTYNRGPDGRIAAIRERSGQGESVIRYTYDTMGRLTQAAESGGQEYRYEYDMMGNRTRATSTGSMDQICTYDWAGRLTSVDGKECNYDVAGNLSTIVISDSKINYQYNPDCKLSIVNDQIFYKYEGEGNLIEQQSDGEKTDFISDPFSDFWQPLVMDSEIRGRTLLIWDQKTPLILITDGKPEYFLSDYIGSTRLIADELGQVKQYVKYDPFGLLEVEINGRCLIPGFSGLFFDSHSKLYLTQSRAYNPALGLFLQIEPKPRIPFGSQNELSLYAYCGNDPVNFFDLTGAWPAWTWGPENLAWQICHNDLLDRNFARRYYDDFSKRTSGLESMFWTSLGGFVTGESYSEDQKLTTIGWDLAGHFITPLGYFRTGTDLFFNLREGKFDKAAKNIGDLAITKYTKHLKQEGKNILRSDLKRNIDKYITEGTLKQTNYNYINGMKTIGDLKAVKKLSHAWDKWNEPIKNSGNLNENHLKKIHHNPINSSPVGGVYLGGAGQLIEGLGALKGIRVDDNGNIFLISEQQGDVKLPPLRIDDVVSVFRSVYLHGEGPTVTIDPNPENPEKSAMIIRHSQATDETYAGWVLYQADRLMKSYTQGVDNITQKDVVSRVPGYADVVNTVYFGAGDPRASQKSGIWERFWIVPAETRRFEGVRRELTLFDVPLKVKTQKMKWEKNALIDDLTGQSSPGALAFTSWFTANYDSIAAEQYLTPPSESGITTPVPVFAELRRIALLTAIAERLREQNVPMPFWMYDYEVRKVTFEKFTPGLEVTWRRSNGDMIETAHIFGGVQLSPESKMVKTYATTSDVSNAPTSIKAELDRSIKLASNLEQAVTDAVLPLNTAPLTVQQFEADNQNFQSIAVPGAVTKDLGPCRLDEIDILIPVNSNNNIQLTRCYNSFFSPKGPWGQGWALDLPRLVEIRVPVDRENGSTSYTFGYELITPLNSLQARFLKDLPVLGFSNPQAPAVDQKSQFRNLFEEQPAFFSGVTTHAILLKDGQEWHFSLQGDLVAVKKGPLITVYERSTEGQVTRIISLFGGQLAGEIKLEYNIDQKITQATGTSFENPQSQPIEVTYAYDDTGHLIGVTSNDGTVGYRYEGSWISAVTWQDHDQNTLKILRSFQYNAQGQMLSETADSLAIMHTISPTPNGLIAASRANPVDDKETNSGTLVSQYDRQMRIIRSVTPAGDSTTWSYPAAGGVEMTVKTADRQSIKITDSPEGKLRRFERDGFPCLTAEYDDGGRLTHLSEFGRSILTQKWRPDGQLSGTVTGGQGSSFEYDSQGLLSSFVLHPATASVNAAEWQQTKLDRYGRPIEVTDYTGLGVQLKYDRSGAMAAVIQQTPEGNYGYQIKRDGQGRIDTVNSSWGKTAYAYDTAGNLQEIVTIRGNKSASVDLVNGQVCAVTDFNDSRTSFEYHQEGLLAGMPLSILCPDGLKLDYEYDASNRLSTVKVGTERCVRLEYDPEGRMISYAWEPAKP